MTMPEMQKAIAKLRFLLASIKGKDEELDGLSRQFHRQLERAPSHAIRGDNSLDSTLSVLGEIQERLDKVSKELDATSTPSSLGLKTSCAR